MNLRLRAAFGAILASFLILGALLTAAAGASPADVSKPCFVEQRTVARTVPQGHPAKSTVRLVRETQSRKVCDGVPVTAWRKATAERLSQATQRAR